MGEMKYKSLSNKGTEEDQVGETGSARQGVGETGSIPDRGMRRDGLSQTAVDEAGSSLRRESEVARRARARQVNERADTNDRGHQRSSVIQTPVLRIQPIYLPYEQCLCRVGALEPRWNRVSVASSEPVWWWWWSMVQQDRRILVEFLPSISIG
ncbi:hypothetical protein BKA70DRAFT_1284215 [Coprinopsis sp. MPI-PUGE-AT-0042]|nr:hypothetical protein BKA70DRAFT_1284215 [Coprinopsis sp. MPI-PUGE-AT-0042]